MKQLKILEDCVICRKGIGLYFIVDGVMASCYYLSTNWSSYFVTINTTSSYIASVCRGVSWQMYTLRKFTLTEETLDRTPPIAINNKLQHNSYYNRPTNPVIKFR